MLSSYQVGLWKQESFVVLRLPQSEFFRILLAIVIGYAGAAHRMLHPEQAEVEIMYESHEDRKNIEDILRDFPSLRPELLICVVNSLPACQ
jgi:hypothetical protein